MLQEHRAVGKLSVFQRVEVGEVGVNECLVG